MLVTASALIIQPSRLALWCQGLPGKEDTLHHVEVLHEHVTLRLRAKVAHRVPDPQLDGTLEGGRGGLWGGVVASGPCTGETQLAAAFHSHTGQGLHNRRELGAQSSEGWGDTMLLGLDSRDCVTSFTSNTS